ncbi:GspH/FimT family pseudopilin [Jeongeupia wiesaeckerbachi]|uniref:GspH/FimT family pseudopilin n=1 Tax=Jeongeupia wiesaeckerbachi TaxID=3051218 RepID=UPI003D80466B
MAPHSAGRARGFTLIEMLVAIAILSILLAIGIPSFVDLLNRKRLENTANDYLSLIAYAKSEALKRNAVVYLLATRTNGRTWSIRATTTSPCTSLAACDLRTMDATQYRNVLMDSLSTNLDGTTIDPIRLLPAFSSLATTAQSVVYEVDQYQLKIEMSITGLTRLCVPTSKPVFGGYKTC